MRGHARGQSASGSTPQRAPSAGQYRLTPAGASVGALLERLAAQRIEHEPIETYSIPNAAAARVFAFEEPDYAAGVFSEVIVRRWRNALGRTMWEFEGDEVANRRFLVIGHGSPDTNAIGSALRAAQRRYFVDGGYLEHIIARGPLLSDDGRE